MIDRTFPRHFDNLDEKWRHCALCGYTSSSPEAGEDEDTPAEIVGGCMYPESQLVFKDGLYFCQAHYNFRYRNKAIDDYKPDVSDLEDD